MSKLLPLAFTALLLSSTPLSYNSAFAQTPANPHSVGNPVQDDYFIGEADAPVAVKIEDRLVGGKWDKRISDEFGDPVLQIVRRAYARRNYAPIWTEAGAESLKVFSGSMFDHGIVSETIYKNDHDRLIRTRFKSRSDRAKADADIRLTLAWLRAAKAIGGGLYDEGGAERSRLDGPIRISLVEDLITSGKGDTASQLAELEPRHPQYQNLKAALATYRGYKSAGGWLAIPDGEVVEPGETDPRIPAVRARLTAEGYTVAAPLIAPIEALTPAGTPALRTSTDPVQIDMYDPALERAVKEFQKTTAWNGTELSAEIRLKL